MASRRALIVEAIATALGGATKPADVTVHRSRTLPITSDQLPAMAAYRTTEAVERGDGPRGYKVRRRLRVRVECRVATAADGATLDDAMDPLTTWAVQAVMSDVTLGGLAHNIHEVSTQWLAEDADQVYGAAAVDFDVEYITSASDPESR